jgi:hypothetical protein
LVPTSSLFFSPTQTSAEPSAVAELLEVIVTVKLQLAPADAVQFTSVTPTWKTDPDGGLQLTAPQFPEVVGAAYVTVALHWPAGEVCVTSLGQSIVHVAPELTVTLKLQFSVFPPASVATQVTGVEPSGNAEPDGGTQVTVTQLPVTTGGG